MSKAWALLLGMLLNCCSTEPTGESLGAVKADCSRVNASCTYAVNNSWRDDMNHRKAAYICAAWLAACVPGQGPTPPPVPSATGGARGIGGSNATGGQVQASGGTQAAGGGISTGGSSASQCQQLCSHLAAIGCPTEQTSCVQICKLNTNDKRFSQQVQCELAATSVASCQKCSKVSCR